MFTPPPSVSPCAFNHIVGFHSTLLLQFLVLTMQLQVDTSFVSASGLPKTQSLAEFPAFAHPLAWGGQELPNQSFPGPDIGGLNSQPSLPLPVTNMSRKLGKHFVPSIGKLGWLTWCCLFYPQFLKLHG